MAMRNLPRLAAEDIGPRDVNRILTYPTAHVARMQRSGIQWNSWIALCSLHPGYRSACPAISQVLPLTAFLADERAMDVELHRRSGNQRVPCAIDYGRLKQVLHVGRSSALPFLLRDVELQRVAQCG